MLKKEVKEPLQESESSVWCCLVKLFVQIDCDLVVWFIYREKS